MPRLRTHAHTEDDVELKWFRFVWKDGTSNGGRGYDAADAFRRLGFGAGALAALDYYECTPMAADDSSEGG